MAEPPWQGRPGEGEGPESLRNSGSGSGSVKTTFPESTGYPPLNLLQDSGLPAPGDESQWPQQHPSISG